MAYQASDISVVIPAGNGSRMVGEVVGRVLAASPAPGEVIVVDDRVADGSLDGLPADDKVRVVPNDGGRGPAGGRNAGARAATGPLLLFVDSDVFVRPDIFGRLVDQYNSNYDADAVVGVEAELSELPNFASRYKNLWMRFTYVVLPRYVDLFYTSCASIKRDVFLAAGGMDEGYDRPSVEDTAFGRTLADGGVRVLLDKEIEVEHRKTYGVLGVLRTGYRRGVALARCILRMGTRRGAGGNRTSVPTSFIGSLPASALFLLWAAWLPFDWAWALGGAAATLAAIYLLNVKWLTFLGRRGAGMALGALVLLPAELLCSFGGGVWGTLSYFLLRKRY